jgi:hypothetical protein
MSDSSPFSAEDIVRLLAHECVSPKSPWSTNDALKIDSHLTTICEEIEATTGALSRIEWDHYGSGYASFVDAWFYRPTAEFTAKAPAIHGEHYVGLVVLLSRLAAVFVFMEGEKHWHTKGGSSYLPCFQGVDSFSSPGVIGLAAQVQRVLERQGLRRLSRTELERPLPTGTAVPTILSDEPFFEFDALFHWED